jgi:hypothetical protein
MRGAIGTRFAYPLGGMSEVRILFGDIVALRGNGKGVNWL